MQAYCAQYAHFHLQCDWTKSTFLTFIIILSHHYLYTFYMQIISKHIKL